MLRPAATLRHTGAASRLGLDASVRNLAKGPGGHFGFIESWKRSTRPAEQWRRITRSAARPALCSGLDGGGRPCGALAASAIFGLTLNRDRHAGRSQGGARRHQGTADEGGSSFSPPFPTLCLGNTPTSLCSSRPTRRRWAGRSSSAAWRASSAPIGRSGSGVSSARRRAASLGQVHRAVAPDGRALACKLQYPDMQSAVEADLSQLKLVMSSTSATTAPSRPARSTPRSPTGCAKSSTTGARRGISPFTADARQGEGGERTRRGRRSVDRAPSHHDVDRGRQAARCREESAGGAQRDRRQHVPRLVRAVLLATAPSTATRILATIRSVRTMASTSSISAACASSSPPSSRASSIFISRSSATITSSPSTRMRSGASRTSQGHDEVLNQWRASSTRRCSTTAAARSRKRHRGLRRDVAEKVHGEVRRLGASGRRANSSSWIAPRSVSGSGLLPPQGRDQLACLFHE